MNKIEQQIDFLQTIADDSMGMEAGDRQQAAEAAQSLRLLLDVAKAADAFINAPHFMADLKQDYDLALVALKEAQ